VTVVPVDRAALRAVAERISARKNELARRTVDRFRAEIVGWQTADEASLAGAREFVIRNIESLLTGLEHDEPIHDDLLESAREVAARRVHQGVSLEALLHHGLVWGETLWECVLTAARPDHPEEREAALQIAGRLWRHVDVLYTAMAYAYLDEMTDRALLRSELLDALLAGQGDGERAQRLARLLHRRLGEDHVVVLVRGEGVPLMARHQVAHAARVALDHIVDAARTHLRPATASLLVGIRQGDVVAIYPAAGPEELEIIRRQCAAMTGGLAIDVSVGMSGWHAGRAAIATAYSEAREAVAIAAGTGIRGRAVVLDDVLVDHMLSSSSHARRILEETLLPLVDYDRARGTQLVATLRAYLDASTNLTGTARLLMVHPNTVVYRLRRIRELSGRDPDDMEDLQILYLALRLSELSAGPAEAS
jgi:sugar diacid utilization regulator